MKKGIIATLSTIGGLSIGTTVVGKLLGDRVKDIDKIANKHLDLYLMMNQWVKVKQAGKNLSSYFEQEGYKEIAIYGMHYVGETLVEELAGSNINIKYGIDKDAEVLYADFDLLTPDKALPEVDAIIVTPITFFNEIEEMLSAKMDCPILSLDDILYQV